MPFWNQAMERRKFIEEKAARACSSTDCGGAPAAACSSTDCGGASAAWNLRTILLWRFSKKDLAIQQVKIVRFSQHFSEPKKIHGV